MILQRYEVDYENLNEREAAKIVANYVEGETTPYGWPYDVHGWDATRFEVKWSPSLRYGKSKSSRYRWKKILGEPDRVSDKVYDRLILVGERPPETAIHFEPVRFFDLPYSFAVEYVLRHPRGEIYLPSKDESCEIIRKAEISYTDLRFYAIRPPLSKERKG